MLTTLRRLADLTLLEQATLLQFIALSLCMKFALLATLETFKDKLRYVLSLVFPSLQYMRRRYGTSAPAQLAGWYLARLGRIGVEGFRFLLTWITAVRRTRHD